MSENKSELEAALERSLSRERAARQQAEMQLEEYSREIYSSNLLLQEQTKQARYKQKHLAFLMGVAEDAWQSDTISNLMAKFLKRSSLFTSKSIACFFQIDKALSIKALQFAKSARPEEDPLHDQFDGDYLRQLMGCLNLSSFKSDMQQYNKGIMLRLEDYLSEGKKLPDTYHLYVLPVFHHHSATSDVLGVVCFFYQDEKDIKSLKLQTIDASRTVLVSAIERKSVEQRLKRKLEELEKSNVELQQIQQQLVESEKLASLGLLSAGIAHEINNPVGFVLSNLSTMQEYFEDIRSAVEPIISMGEADSISNEAVLPLLQTLAKNREHFELPFLLSDSEEIVTSSLSGLQRVKEIVADLKTFSRMDNDELVEIELGSVIERALHMLNNELKYKYKVNTNIEPDCHIYGTEGQLQQVFINLIMNAKHAMKDGGTLDISCTRANQRIKVSVKDQGCGISNENLKEIFTPFFTTKAPGEGTGLGLSISYSILKQHHAKVTVNSVVDEGTEFLLSFIAVDN